MPPSHLILCRPLLLLPQSLPTSGSFPMIQLFTWGSQSIGVSASASVLPVNTQDWFPLVWTGWISLQSKGLSRVFSNTTFQKHHFFGAHSDLPIIKVIFNVIQTDISILSSFNFVERKELQLTIKIVSLSAWQSHKSAFLYLMICRFLCVWQCFKVTFSMSGQIHLGENKTLNNNLKHFQILVILLIFISNTCSMFHVNCLPVSLISIPLTP